MKNIENDLNLLPTKSNLIPIVDAKSANSDEEANYSLTDQSDILDMDLSKSYFSKSSSSLVDYSVSVGTPSATHIDDFGDAQSTKTSKSIFPSIVKLGEIFKNQLFRVEKMRIKVQSLTLIEQEIHAFSLVKISCTLPSFGECYNTQNRCTTGGEIKWEIPTSEFGSYVNADKETAKTFNYVIDYSKYANITFKNVKDAFKWREQNLELHVTLVKRDDHLSENVLDLESRKKKPTTKVQKERSRVESQAFIEARSSLMLEKIMNSSFNYNCISPLKRIQYDKNGGIMDNEQCVGSVAIQVTLFCGNQLSQKYAKPNVDDEENNKKNITLMSAMKSEINDVDVLFHGEKKFSYNSKDINSDSRSNLVKESNEEVVCNNKCTSHHMNILVESISFPNNTCDYPEKWVMNMSFGESLKCHTDKNSKEEKFVITKNIQSIKYVNFKWDPILKLEPTIISSLENLIGQNNFYILFELREDSGSPSSFAGIANFDLSLLVPKSQGSGKEFEIAPCLAIRRPLVLKSKMSGKEIAIVDVDIAIGTPLQLKRWSKIKNACVLIQIWYRRRFKSKNTFYDHNEVGLKENVEVTNLRLLTIKGREDGGEKSDANNLFRNVLELRISSVCVSQGLEKR